MVPKVAAGYLGRQDSAVIAYIKAQEEYARLGYRPELIIDARKEYENGMRFFRDGSYESAYLCFTGAQEKGSREAARMMVYGLLSGLNQDSRYKSDEYALYLLYQLYTDSVAPLDCKELYNYYVDNTGDVSFARDILEYLAYFGDKEAAFWHDSQGLTEAEAYYPADQRFAEVSSAAAAFAPAQCKLGYYYAQGKHCAQDSARAISCWKQAAERKDADAAYELASSYLNGAGVPQNDSIGSTYIITAANGGNIVALEAVSFHYFCLNDNETAIIYASEGARRGSARCTFLLADYYSRHPELGVSDSTIIKVYHRAYELGFSPAGGVFARALLKGDAIEQDVDSALSILQANDTAAWAQYIYGEYYASDAYGARDDKKSFASFKRAAEGGIPEAMYNMGNCYYYGTGVSKNPKEAFLLYKKAADEGVQDAQLMIAWMYCEGKVEKDFAKGVEMMAYLSDSVRHYLAPEAWGSVYYEGYSGKKDYERAFEIWNSHLEQDPIYCAIYAGSCYYEGKGVKKDTQKAMQMWDSVLALLKEGGYDNDLLLQLAEAVDCPSFYKYVKKQTK